MPYAWLTMAAAVVASLATCIYAYVANRQLQTMKQQAKSMQDSLLQTTIAADAAKKSAEAAEKAVEQAAEQMRLERRGWLAIIRPELSPLVADQNLTCSIQVKNSGASPGTITKKEITWGIVPSNDEGIQAAFNASPRNVSEDRRVIPPGEVMCIPLATDQMDYSSLDKVENGIATLVLIVRLKYADGAGGVGLTISCFAYDVAAKRLAVYGEHNEMA